MTKNNTKLVLAIRVVARLDSLIEAAQGAFMAAEPFSAAMFEQDRLLDRLHQQRRLALRYVKGALM